MKKLLVVLLLGAIWAVKAEAAGPTRGAKAQYTLAYTTTVSSPTANAGPFVVYSVMVSTGAAGDFVALYDSATVTGITSAVSTAAVFRGRCYAQSASTTSFCNFDPPLQFNNGLEAVLSTTSDWAVITYEKGRVTQGY